MAHRYQSFSEFYPFYLSQHQHRYCRVLHYIGSSCALIFIGFAFYYHQALWLAASLVSGYAFAWVGHFFIEKNKPATFSYPLWSFIGDWRMFAEAVTGKLKI